MKPALLHTKKAAKSGRTIGIMLAFMLTGLLVFWGASAVQAQTGGNQLEAAKREAIDQIARRGPPLIKLIQERYSTAQNQRLYLLDLAVLVLIPLAGLVSFGLFPRFARKAIANRASGADPKQLSRLYWIQGVVAAAVLFSQGFCLWLLQVGLTTLANFTNPQIVLQERAISYVVDNSEELVNKYTDLFVRVAQNFDADPDLTIFSNLINNTRQLRDDPLLNFGSSAIDFLQPVLSNLLVITLLVLLFLFLRRLWPDLKKMLYYPLEVITTEQSGSGATVTTRSAMWANGRRLILAEIKVILCFAVLAVGLALLTAIFLQLFFSPIVRLVLDYLTFALAYFTQKEGASGLVVFSSLILVLFLVECVVLFLLAFSFITGKILGGLRNRFLGKFSWPQTRRFITRNVLAVFRVVALLAVTSYALTVLARFLLPDFSKTENPNWTLILIGVPLLLLIGLNLIMALTGGFRRLIRIVRNTEALDIVAATVAATSN